MHFKRTSTARNPLPQRSTKESGLSDPLDSELSQVLGLPAHWICPPFEYYRPVPRAVGVFPGSVLDLKHTRDEGQRLVLCNYSVITLFTPHHLLSPNKGYSPGFFENESNNSDTSN